MTILIPICVQYRLQNAFRQDYCIGKRADGEQAGVILRSQVRQFQTTILGDF